MENYFRKLILCTIVVKSSALEYATRDRERNSIRCSQNVPITTEKQVSELFPHRLMNAYSVGEY